MPYTGISEGEIEHFMSMKNARSMRHIILKVTCATFIRLFDTITVERPELLYILANIAQEA